MSGLPAPFQDLLPPVTLPIPSQAPQKLLGIIEVFRKASEPIEFEFRPVDGQRSFFCMKVVI